MSHILKVASLIQFMSWVIPLFPILALWGNKNWPPSMKVEKAGKILRQDGLRGVQMVQFECPNHSKLSLMLNY